LWDTEPQREVFRRETSKGSYQRKAETSLKKTENIGVIGLDLPQTDHDYGISKKEEEK
jgi:hypothetical protein